MIAQSFTQAIVIPYAVGQSGMGKIPLGIMKVIMFGPKLVKKIARQ
jgi:hypothetical protein